MISKLTQNPAVLNLQKQYEALPQRDRLALKILSIVLGLCLLYFGLWVPAQGYMNDAKATLEQRESLVKTINENKAILRSVSSSSSTRSGAELTSQQLVSSVTNLAKKKGLNLKRFEPSGENKLKVWMDEVPFDKMVSWLNDLKKNLGVRVEQISVEKEDKAGLISARLTLAS